MMRGSLYAIAALPIFTIYACQTDDPCEAVAGPDYFTPQADCLHRNDLIVVCADAHGTSAWSVLVVESADRSAVVTRSLDRLTAERLSTATFLTVSAMQACGNGLTVRREGRKYAVRDASGNLVAQGLSKAEAEKVATEGAEG